MIGSRACFFPAAVSMLAACLAFAGCGTDSSPSGPAPAPTGGSSDSGQPEGAADSPAPPDGPPGADSAGDGATEAPDGTPDVSDAPLPETGALTNPCESTACTQCHGTKGTLNCAPPLDTKGHALATDPGVGAHQAHLLTGPKHPAVASRPVECADCHAVPTQANLSGGTHMNGVANVVFKGPVAGKVVSATPASFDPATQRCSDVYCHRPRQQTGGFNPNPVWTKPGTAVCGACHTLPPAAPHPQVAECQTCHSAVIGDGGVWVKPELHINGTADVSGCNVCHGSVTNEAPPLGTHGEKDTTARAVGAHQAHLATTVAGMGFPHKVFTCSQCHHKPADYYDTAHLDGDGVAEVKFPAAEGSIAAKDNVTPSWERGAGQCTVYCHGTAAKGATNPKPTWTMPAPGQGNVACGSCHGLPPAKHFPVAATACGGCHGDVVKLNTSTQKLEFVNPELHVNGDVNVKQNCDGCHGGAPGNFSAPAPPYDLGTPPATASTDPQVGAHQAHLAQIGSQMGSVSQIKHAVIPCAECHIVPASVFDVGHLDPAGLPAEIQFGVLASLGQKTPPKLDKTNPQAPKCTNTYCHGGSLCDGYGKAPKWNGGSTEAMCGTCHGIPPAESRGVDGVCGGTAGFKHSLGLGLTDCATCHPATMKTTGATTWEWADDGKCHANGKVSTATCDN
jgi:predicted CxxxxCH...CXXCH cytochrome family protein